MPNQPVLAIAATSAAKSSFFLSIPSPTTYSSKLLTVEVRPSTRLICQARGKCNAMPAEKHRGILRRWAEQAYPNLIYFNEVDKGGHFVAWEQPQLFSEEVRAGFRPLQWNR